MNLNKDQLLHLITRIWDLNEEESRETGNGLHANLVDGPHESKYQRQLDELVEGGDLDSYLDAIEMLIRQAKEMNDTPVVRALGSSIQLDLKRMSVDELIHYSTQSRLTVLELYTGIFKAITEQMMESAAEGMPAGLAEALEEAAQVEAQDEKISQELESRGRCTTVDQDPRED